MCQNQNMEESFYRNRDEMDSFSRITGQDILNPSQIYPKNWVNPLTDEFNLYQD